MNIEENRGRKRVSFLVHPMQATSICKPIYSFVRRAARKLPKKTYHIRIPDQRDIVCRMCNDLEVGSSMVTNDASQAQKNDSQTASE